MKDFFFFTSSTNEYVKTKVRVVKTLNNNSHPCFKSYNLLWDQPHLCVAVGGAATSCSDCFSTK